MKRNVLFCLIMLMSLPAISQIRHVRGIKAVGLYAGKPQYGSLVGVDFIRYMTNKSYWQVAGFFDKSELNEQQATSIGLDFTYNHSVYNYQEKIYFNVSGGATVSTDKAKSQFYTNDVSSLKYGLLVGFQVEAFINSRFVVVGGWNTRYLFSEKLGRQRYYHTLGIRYNL